MGWIIVGSLAGLFALNALIHLFFALLVLPVFERKPLFNVQPASPDESAGAIEIPTRDGLVLRGSVYRHEDGASRGLIIFCPEMGANHWSAMSYCRGVWEAGFDVLAFDFRNQGESDHLPGYNPMHWLTEYEVADLLAVIDYIEADPRLKQLPCGLFGISRGGVAALAAAARRRAVRCVACESAFSTLSLMSHFTLRWASLFVPDWVMRPIPRWHLRNTMRVVQWLSQFRRGCRYTALERELPRLRDRTVLMIAGGADTYVPPSVTESLCRRMPPACSNVWVVPRAKHNGARQVEPEAYDRKLEAFFAESLEQPAKPAEQHR